MTEQLTEAELRVARYLLAADLSNEEIARILHVSANTVKTHARHVYRKLGATGGRKELRKNPTMRRICNGQDPNLKTPEKEIGNCGRTFDDTTASTICPHKDFGALKAQMRYSTLAPEEMPRTAAEPAERLQFGRPDLLHHHHPLATTGCDGDCVDPADRHAYAVLLMDPVVMWMTLDIDAARHYAERNGGVVVAMPFVMDFRGKAVDEAESMARQIQAEGVPAGAAAVIAANFHGRPRDAYRLAEKLGVTRVPEQGGPPLDEAVEPAPGCAGYRLAHPQRSRCQDPHCGRCWAGWFSIPPAER